MFVFFCENDLYSYKIAVKFKAEEDKIFFDCIFNIFYISRHLLYPEKQFLIENKKIAFDYSP